MVLTDNVKRHTVCQNFSPPATQPWKSDSMKLWFLHKQRDLSALCHVDKMPWVSNSSKEGLFCFRFRDFSSQLMSSAQAGREAERRGRSVCESKVTLRASRRQRESKRKGLGAKVSSKSSISDLSPCRTSSRQPFTRKSLRGLAPRDPIASQLFWFVIQWWVIGGRGRPGGLSFETFAEKIMSLLVSQNEVLVSNTAV